MDFGVTVLASLGGRHLQTTYIRLCAQYIAPQHPTYVDDLARSVLDADVSTLSQGRALHRVWRHVKFELLI